MKKNYFLFLAFMFAANAVIQGFLLESPWFGTLMAAMAVLMLWAHRRLSDIARCAKDRTRL